MEQLQPYIPFIAIAVNGLIAGWLAGLLLGGGGLFRNLFVGIIGAFVGAFLLRLGYLSFLTPYSTGMPWADEIVVSTIGAIIVVILARLIAR